jgi:DNA-binding beta-propeller fold protein YncE
MSSPEIVAVSGYLRDIYSLYVLGIYEDAYEVMKVINISERDKILIHSMESIGSFVYLVDSFNNKILRINTQSEELIETTVGRDPRHICIGKECMYAANFESDNISIIDLDSFSLTGSLPSGIKPHDLKSDEKTGRLYVSCYEENRIAEYDIESGSVQNYITEGKPMHLFLDEKDIIAMTYYANGNVETKINFIDKGTKKISDLLTVEGLGSDIAFDREGKRLYMINIVGRSLVAVDTEGRKIMQSYVLGGYPENLSIGKNSVFVTNSKKRQISIINKKNLSLTRNVYLQFTPDCIKSLN